MAILKYNGKIFNLAGSTVVSSIINISTVIANLTYNGEEQSPTIIGYDSNTMTIGGTTSGINAGNYEVTFTPKNGYKWSDGSTTTKSVTWTIAKE